MKKQKVDNFKTDVDGLIARQLVLKVFALKLTYSQMAEGSGLSKDQLYRIKLFWVKKTGFPKFMKKELVNGLVKLQNTHNDVQVNDELSDDNQEINFFVIDLMIKRRGLRKTDILLRKRGKTKILKKYLKTLTVSQLADLL